VDWSVIVNSKVAELIPALVGVALILAVVLVAFAVPVLALVWKVVGGLTGAIKEQTRTLGAALDRHSDTMASVRAEMHTDTVEKIKAIHALGQQCVDHHAVQDGKTDLVMATLTRIETSLGKA
jgi:hypothetical protein